jgi:hypothetical protein
MVRVLTTATNGTGSATSSSATSAVITGSSGANVWVSSAGAATCSRSATPISYSTALTNGDVCTTWGAVYPIAACGDLVYIKGGTYANQPGGFDGSSKDGCSTPVVFSGAPGETVLTDDIGGVGSWWTLENITLGNTGSALHAEVGAQSPASHVTLNNITGGRVYLTNVSNVLVENSHFGPCYAKVSPDPSPDPNVTCNSNVKIDGGSNITFKNNVIHDFIDDDSNPATNHFECSFIRGGSNITFDSNKFYNCQIYAIFIQDSFSVINGVTIENNWFWATQNLIGACSADRVCPTPDTRDSAVTFGGSSSMTNILVRYNSFDPGNGIVNEVNAGTNVRVVGNIIGFSGTCIGAVTYAYNVWLTGSPSTCNATDTQATSPFVLDGQSGTTLDDLHLGPSPCTSNTAVNLVTPNTADYQLNYDIDGNARNSSGPRDAGATAGASCGT